MPPPLKSSYDENPRIIYELRRRYETDSLRLLQQRLIIIIFLFAPQSNQLSSYPILFIYEIEDGFIKSNLNLTKAEM